MTSVELRPCLDPEALATLRWRAMDRHEPLSLTEEQVLLAVEEEKIVGYIAWLEIADELHIHEIGVPPEARRRGIGALLLRSVLDEARQRGASVAVLEVASDNLAALALYRRQGYVCTRRRVGYYGRERDAMEMVLQMRQEEAS